MLIEGQRSVPPAIEQPALLDVSESTDVHQWSRSSSAEWSCSASQEGASKWIVGHGPFFRSRFSSASSASWQREFRQRSSSLNLQRIRRFHSESNVQALLRPVVGSGVAQDRAGMPRNPPLLQCIASHLMAVACSGVFWAYRAIGPSLRTLQVSSSSSGSKAASATAIANRIGSLLIVAAWMS